MKGELLEMVEREVLGWPEVSKEERGGGGRGGGGFWVPPATVYSFGRTHRSSTSTTPPA